VAAALAACGASQHVATSPGERRIASIRFEGARAFDHDELADGLITQRTRDNGQPFSYSLVREDRHRILRRYLTHGYFASQVDSDIVEESDRAVDVVFNIVEGPRAILAAVSISGLPPDVNVAEVRDAIAMQSGKPFDYDAYNLAKPKIVEVLQQHGYAHAQLD